MSFPIRCFTCGKVIGGKYEKYRSLLRERKTAADAFQELGILRRCCRRMFLGHVEVVDKLLVMSQVFEDANRDIPVTWVPRPTKRQRPNMCVAR